MLNRHDRALGRARTAGAPAGQIGRALETQRIDGALQRSFLDE